MLLAGSAAHGRGIAERLRQFVSFFNLTFRAHSLAIFFGCRSAHASACSIL
jgi:hypothetical protein